MEGQSNGVETKETTHPKNLEEQPVRIVEIVSANPGNNWVRVQGANRSEVPFRRPREPYYRAVVPFDIEKAEVTRRQTINKATVPQVEEEVTMTPVSGSTEEVKSRAVPRRGSRTIEEHLLDLLDFIGGERNAT